MLILLLGKRAYTLDRRVTAELSLRKGEDMPILVEETEETPLLLRRIEEKPEVSHPTASHFTVVTTPGMEPEMHDQQEDAVR